MEIASQLFIFLDQVRFTFRCVRRKKFCGSSFSLFVLDLFKLVHKVVVQKAVLCKLLDFHHQVCFETSFVAHIELCWILISSLLLLLFVDLILPWKRQRELSFATQVRANLEVGRLLNEVVFIHFDDDALRLDKHAFVFF